MVGNPPSGLMLQSPPPPKLDLNMICVPSGDHCGVSQTTDRTVSTWSTTARGVSGCWLQTGDVAIGTLRPAARMHWKREFLFMVCPEMVGSNTVQGGESKNLPTLHLVHEVVANTGVWL